MLGFARVQLCVDALAQELHDQVEFGLAQDRLDRTDDPELCADLYSLADFERPLARQATGRSRSLHRRGGTHSDTRSRPSGPSTIRLNSDFDAKRRRCRRGWRLAGVGRAVSEDGAGQRDCAFWRRMSSVAEDELRELRGRVV